MNLLAAIGFAFVISVLTQYGATVLASKKIDGKNIVYMHEKSKQRPKKVFS
jgi:hypothetical protein